MASSGSFTTSSEKNLSMMVSWSIKSQSIENNTSTISWTLKGYRTDGATGYITCGGFKVVINGVTVYSKSTGYRVDVYNGTVVASGETTISHNADGTKSFTASAEAAIYYSAVNCSGSGTFTLNTIPRATTPTVSGTLSLGSSITISTSGRASTNFKHNLYYSWGSQITDSLIASDVTTSKTWTIPKTLAEYIMGGTSGTLYLKCVTYSGSTEVGTKTITLTISVPNTAEFQPTIQSVSTAEANSLPFARYVVGKTQLTVSVTAVGAYVSGSSNRNSYPVKAVVTVDGVNYNVTLSQSSVSTWSITTNLLTSAGSKSGTVTITDSRGRSVSKTFSYTAFAYAPPAISSFTANRCLSDGTLDDGGTYILLGLKTTISSVDNLNAKTYKFVYEKNGSEVTLKSGTLSAYANNVLNYNSYSGGVTFSVDGSWTVRVYVYDSFNSSMPAVATVIVPTEATFMDWRENGKGLAFFKVSEKDGLEVAKAAYFYDKLYVNNTSVRAKRCVVGQSENTKTKPWYKFASLSSTAAFSDYRISFKVTSGYSTSLKHGILNASVRLNRDGAFESGSLILETNTGLNPENFVLAYGDGNYELWVQISLAYNHCHFEVITETSRTGFSDSWTLYNISSAGYAEEPTSGYTQIEAASVDQVISEGTSGIWSYRKWTSGRVELDAIYPVSNTACTTALGTLYRTAVLQPNSFPFTVYNPKLMANYESDGYGAFLWATTTTTTAKPPSYYLVRPTSTTIVSGRIIFHVVGEWE